MRSALLLVLLPVAATLCAGECIYTWQNRGGHRGNGTAERQRSDPVEGAPCPLFLAAAVAIQGRSAHDIVHAPFPSCAAAHCASPSPAPHLPALPPVGMDSWARASALTSTRAKTPHRNPASQQPAYTST